MHDIPSNVVVPVEREKKQINTCIWKKKNKKKKGMCKSFKFSVIGHVKNKKQNR